MRSRAAGNGRWLPMVADDVPMVAHNKNTAKHCNGADADGAGAGAGDFACAGDGFPCPDRYISMENMVSFL